MESPESWDLLTASLAISNLHDPSSTWTFLVVQGLVRDEPRDCEAFGRFAQVEVNQVITGPSAAARVALSLREAGIAQPAGRTPDPCARMAAARLASIEPRPVGSSAEHKSLDHLASTSHTPKPWWKFW